MAGNVMDSLAIAAITHELILEAQTTMNLPRDLTLEGAVILNHSCIFPGFSTKHRKHVRSKFHGILGVRSKLANEPHSPPLPLIPFEGLNLGCARGHSGKNVFPGLLGHCCLLRQTRSRGPLSELLSDCQNVRANSLNTIQPCRLSVHKNSEKYHGRAGHNRRAERRRLLRGVIGRLGLGNRPSDL
jgi:hypothetical protein